MRPFSPTPEGLTSHLEPHEALLLARAADEVAALLDAPIIDPGLIAALTDDIPAPPDPTDRSLSNLLRPMASDPALDDELRSLTGESLRQDKAARLELCAESLRAAATAGGHLLIRRGEEWTWLAALTDLRLALAGTLGATSSADVEAVQDYAVRVALATDPAPVVDENAPNPLVATIFTLVGAWQESLLGAMDAQQGPH